MPGGEGLGFVNEQRSILFDTETTGLDPRSGDRVIEIACLELVRDLPTGRVFHRLIDPDRDIPPEATRVHGFTRADLAGKPRFAQIADELLAFLEDSPMIAHNAPFDFGFLDAELERLGLAKLAPSRMIDTLAMAKTRFPGLPNSLDALCRRFGIDLSERTSHNALLDCRLLAEVYVELTGGRQRGLMLASETAKQAAPVVTYTLSGPRTIRLLQPSPEALARHAAFVARLKEPLWLT
jgi:DNA polymerase III subunit epsilon